MRTILCTMLMVILTGCGDVQQITAPPTPPPRFVRFDSMDGLPCTCFKDTATGRLYVTTVYHCMEINQEPLKLPAEK